MTEIFPYFVFNIKYSEYYLIGLKHGSLSRKFNFIRTILGIISINSYYQAKSRTTRGRLKDPQEYFFHVFK